MCEDLPRSREKLFAPPRTGANCSTGVVYTPTTGYTGPDSFTFKANDGALDSNLATVGIAVIFGPVNAAPVSNPLNAATALNTPRALMLSASDADLENLKEVLHQVRRAAILTRMPGRRLGANLAQAKLLDSQLAIGGRP